MSRLKEFIADLELLYDDKISCSYFERKYYPPKSNCEVEGVPDLIGGLHHYFADEGLRKKDKEYLEMQKGELRKLINLLKEGAPEDELHNISFLEDSDNYAKRMELLEREKQELRPSLSKELRPVIILISIAALIFLILVLLQEVSSL